MLGGFVRPVGAGAVLGQGWVSLGVGALSWSALCWDCPGRLAGAGMGVDKSSGLIPQEDHFGGRAQLMWV